MSDNKFFNGRSSNHTTGHDHPHPIDGFFGEPLFCAEDAALLCAIVSSDSNDRIDEAIASPLVTSRVKRELMSGRSASRSARIDNAHQILDRSLQRLIADDTIFKFFDDAETTARLCNLLNLALGGPRNRLMEEGAASVLTTAANDVEAARAQLQSDLAVATRSGDPHATEVAENLLSLSDDDLARELRAMSQFLTDR